MANAQEYTLTMTNNSDNAWDFCVFQQDPDLGVPNVVSLAWFTKHCHPDTTVTFNWATDYCFIWSRQAKLKPGISFHQNQSKPTTLDDNNQIRLMFETSFHFAEQQNTTRGTLQILTDSTVPIKKGYVGIGMSGSGTFVVPAQPNLQLKFVPHPKYWVTFGYYKPGEVLDLEEMTYIQEIEYAPGIFSRNISLNPSNTWELD